MRQTVRMAELVAMEPEVRERRMAELVRVMRSEPNGEIADVDAQIRDFERRYELRSELMKAELAAGTRRETGEICRWLMLLKLRDRLASLAARAR